LHIRGQPARVRFAGRFFVFFDMLGSFSQKKRAATPLWPPRPGERGASAHLARLSISDARKPGSRQSVKVEPNEQFDQSATAVNEICE
jgi:hypothetical protein